MKRAGILGLAIVLALGLAAGGTASKRAKKHYFISTAVLLDDEAPTFSGKIASPKGACKRGRKVELRFHGEGSDDVSYGTTTSNSDGTWELTVNQMLPSGGYQFRADRKKLKPKHGRKRICRKSVPADMELP